MIYPPCGHDCTCRPAPLLAPIQPGAPRNRHRAVQKHEHRLHPYCPPTPEYPNPFLSCMDCSHTVAGTDAAKLYRAEAIRLGLAPAPAPRRTRRAA